MNPSILLIFFITGFCYGSLVASREGNGALGSDDQLLWRQGNTGVLGGTDNLNFGGATGAAGDGGDAGGDAGGALSPGKQGTGGPDMKTIKKEINTIVQSLNDISHALTGKGKSKK